MTFEPNSRGECSAPVLSLAEVIGHIILTSPDLQKYMGQCQDSKFPVAALETKCTLGMPSN